MIIDKIMYQIMVYCHNGLYIIFSQGEFSPSENKRIFLFKQNVILNNMIVITVKRLVGSIQILYQYSN